MLGYNTMDEMIIEFDISSVEKINKENKTDEFVLYKEPNLVISRIFDIFDNIIYDRTKTNNEFYMNFLLKRVKKELNQGDNIFTFYKSKQIAYDECIYYIYFESESDELKKKYSISSNIKTYHANGNIHLDFYHNNGKIEGIYKKYDANGNKIDEIFYIDGKYEKY